ncbi:MAG: outer membrane beta-barrel protein [Bacteroidales bacterium]
MRNKEANNTHNREDDNFYDYFRDALKDHQADVDEKCWENISTHIGPKRRGVLWPVLYSAAVAAIVLLLLFLDIKEETPKEQLPAATAVTAGATAGQRIAVNNQKSADKPKRDTNRYIVLSRQTIEKPYENDIISKEETLPAEKDKSGTDSSNLYNMADNLFSDNETKIRKENKWAISVSLGTLGKTSVSSINNYTTQTLQPLQSYTTQTFQPLQSFEIASNSISDAEYAAPFSIGLLISKELNNTLSLESGVVYSYLSTTYTSADNQQYRAKLKLHYIGIPVNFVADMWDISHQCKLYASTGLMIEKGVQSDFSQYLSETKQSITSNQSIKGVQWSINASLGLSYRIYRNWNIYLEPHLSYYFDNNQPISIRTQKHTIIGVNSGLRFEF